MLEFLELKDRSKRILFSGYISNFKWIWCALQLSMFGKSCSCHFLSYRASLKEFHIADIFPTSGKFGAHYSVNIYGMLYTNAMLS